MDTSFFYKGNFGLERETLRIDRYGRLARTPHPFPDDEHITRDFCENQAELITPVYSSIDEAAASLGELDRRIKEVISKRGESIWLYSNPPAFENESEIPIARFTGSHISKKNYRVALQYRYGKRIMLLSGVHFNFSFTDDWLVGMYGKGADSQDFKNRIYMRLYKQLMRHSWLIVLLTAASAYYDRSFDSDGASGAVLSRYSSLRNSERGYWNSFIPVFDHTDLDSFCVGVLDLIRKSILFSVSELYLPIRLKPKGLNSIENLAEGGVDHIELRMFDLVPDKPLGIDTDDLKFAHLLILYLLTLPDTEFTEQQQIEAVRMHQTAALYDVGEDLIKRAQQLLSDMSEHFGGDAYAQSLIGYEAGKLRADKAKRFVNYYDRGEDNVRTAGLFRCGKDRSGGGVETVLCTQR
ncbi:MAG: glutathione synthase [Ruminococcus sp.]|nr:glutathione synthase [Ruminococcus sp.]